MNPAEIAATAPMSDSYEVARRRHFRRRRLLPSLVRSESGPKLSPGDFDWVKVDIQLGLAGSSLICSAGHKNQHVEGLEATLQIGVVKHRTSGPGSVQFGMHRRQQFH